MATRPIILIIGTRPEGIKMAPVYHALKRAGLPVITVCTMQHDQLLADVLELFQIVPDYTLDIMRIGQDLFYLTQAVLQKTKKIFTQLQPSLVLVQGDTTSSMAAALSAFYLQIPVGHVEAGLRTDDVYSPFPEEMNRRVISMIAQYHFAPTSLAVATAQAYGVRPEQIFCTGNTVVDALHYIKERIAQQQDMVRADVRTWIEQARSQGKKIALLTLHRRESFGVAMQRVLQTVRRLAEQNPDVVWIYPYHPNPQVVQALEMARLQDMSTVVLLEPVSYITMVYVLDHADFILTDSGGIQEEAISLLKPVLVLREKTERMEGVLAGLAQVVGTDADRIEQAVHALLYGTHTTHGADAAHTYGDGRAADAIVAIVRDVIGVHAHETPQVPVAHATAQEIFFEKREQIMKQVAVVGLGYIGLPTAIMVAECGLSVRGIDINADRVDHINRGEPDLYEPDLYEKLQLVQTSGNFRAYTAMVPADYFIIAVPTPITPDKKADLRAVFAAAASIAPVLKRGNVVILESTVSVGTTQQLAEFLTAKTGFVVGKDIFVAHSPERVLPGKIFYELEHNDRIIGGITQQCAQRAQELYELFVVGTLCLTNAATAELVKLVENSARDVEIAFAHQVASMAYAQGLDPYRVIELANKHPRVNILKPTCGVGGHCIAVDPWFLVETFPQHTQLIAAARSVNDAKPLEVIAAIDRAIAQWQHTHAKIPTVAFFGLTYKANVDDLRESPACHIVAHYAASGAVPLMICEPYVKKQHMPVFAADHVASITDAIASADIIVFLVAHDQFKVIDVSRVSSKKVIDYCGLLHRPKPTPYAFAPAIRIDNLDEPAGVHDELSVPTHKEEA